MEFSKHSKTICPENFWQVGLLDIVLSEYPDKSHNFTNFIFMTSSLLYSISNSEVTGEMKGHPEPDRFALFYYS